MRAAAPSRAARRPTRRSLGTTAIARLAQGHPQGLGAYMAVAHRLSSLLITVYLFVHLFTLGSVLDGPQSFDRVMEMFENRTLRLLELGLVVLVVFHLLNGIRLGLLHLGAPIGQRPLSFGVIAITAAVGIGSLPIFLGS